MIFLDMFGFFFMSADALLSVFDFFCSKYRQIGFLIM